MLVKLVKKRAKSFPNVRLDGNITEIGGLGYLYLLVPRFINLNPDGVLCMALGVNVLKGIVP